MLWVKFRQRDTAAAVEPHVADRHPCPARGRLERPERKSRPDEERADVRRVAGDGHARIVIVLRHIARIEPDVSRPPREDARFVVVACIDDDLPAQRRHGHRAHHQRMWRLSLHLLPAIDDFRPRCPRADRSSRARTRRATPSDARGQFGERRRRASQTPAPSTSHSQGSMMKSTSP